MAIPAQFMKTAAVGKATPNTVSKGMTGTLPADKKKKARQQAIADAAYSAEKTASSKQTIPIPATQPSGPKPTPVVTTNQKTWNPGAMGPLGKAK